MNLTINPHWSNNIKNTIFYVGISLIKLPIGLLVFPYYSKNLSSYDFAALGFFGAIATYSTPLLALNLYNYYMYSYNQCSELENKRIARTLISFLIIYDIFMATIIWAVLSIYLNLTGSAFNSYPLALVVLLTSSLSMAIGFWNIELRFKNKSISYFFLNLIILLSVTTLSFIFIVFFRLGALGKLLPLMLVQFVVFITYYSKYIKNFSLHKPIIIDAIKYSLPLTIAGIVSLPLITLDKFLLERYHDYHEFGIFMLANEIVNYFALVLGSIFQAFQPDIYRHINNNNKKELLNTWIIIIVIFTTTFIIFNVLSPHLINYITAGKYNTAIKYVNKISFSVLMVTISYIFSQSLFALGYTKITILNSIMFMIISIILYYFFIRWWKYDGAIYAKALIYMIISLVLLLQIKFRNSTFMLKFR
jgi:O-antigen/teichoic acid export membrane protein